MSDTSTAPTWRTIILFGVIVWLVPFVIGFFLYTPEGQPRFSEDLFESVMAVSLASITSYMAYRLFSRTSTIAASGLVVGVAWLAISIILDVPTIIFGFDMPVGQYVTEVALSYLMIPAITIAVAKTAKARKAAAS
ncbi:MAG: hypothetical protein EXR11_12455 [Rhodospirillaceae bacterium]|nr:hypothetical protein [Rhodospirillaceae bacterium]